MSRSQASRIRRDALPPFTANRCRRTTVCLPRRRIAVPGQRCVSLDNGLSYQDDALPPSTADRCRRTTVCLPRRRVVVPGQRFASLYNGLSYQDDALPPSTVVRRLPTTSRLAWRQSVVLGQRTVAVGGKASYAETDRRRERQIAVDRRRSVAAGRRTVIYVQWIAADRGNPSETDGEPLPVAAARRPMGTAEKHGTSSGNPTPLGPRLRRRRGGGGW
jgi:hypothetical protein